MSKLLKVDPEQIRGIARVRAEQLRRRTEALKGENNPMHRNAEYQRRSMMSQDERNATAIEQMAKGRKEFNDAKSGRETSFEQAKREVLDVVKKSLRDQGNE